MGLLPPSGRQAVEILGFCCSSDHPISAGFCDGASGVVSMGKSWGLMG